MPRSRSGTVLRNAMVPLRRAPNGFWSWCTVRVCLIGAVAWSAIHLIRREGDCPTLDIDSMSRNDMVEYILWKNSSSCRSVHGIGGELREEVMYFLVGDVNITTFVGQKSVCLDREVFLDVGDCLVYSFGISAGWSFEESMARLGCQVYAFEPALDVSQRKNLTRVHFYEMSLAAENSGDGTAASWKLGTLDSIYESLRPRHGDAAIDVLQLDVDGAEWFAVPQIVESGMLARVKQLAMTVNMKDVPPFPEFYKILLKIVRSLEDHGMVRFSSRPVRTSDGAFLEKPGFLIYELSWFNSRFAV